MNVYFRFIAQNTDVQKTKTETIIPNSLQLNTGVAIGLTIVATPVVTPAEKRITAMNPKKFFMLCVFVGGYNANLLDKTKSYSDISI